MYIIFLSPFLITVFMLFGIALAYQAYLVLHGVIFIIAVLLFAAEIICGIYILVEKAKQNRSNSRRTTKWHVIMSLAASMLHLYTSYLVVSDIRSYGDGLFDMITFFFGLLVGVGLWAYSLAGWMEAIIDEGFHYKGFLREIIVAAILVFLIYIW